MLLLCKPAGYFIYNIWRTKFFAALQSLGKMTLTNYLLVSSISVILLYGIGFGQLGILSMHTIWICAFVWLYFELHSALFGLKDSDMGPLNGYGDNLLTNEEFN